MTPADSHVVALAPLCAAAAVGPREALTTLARAALEAGCTGEEVREALLTLVPFCGFPRTLDALAEVRPFVPDVAPEDAPEASSCAADRPSRGAAFFDRVYGGDAAKVRANLRSIDAEVAGWIERDAYGKVLSRTAIPASLRERIGVVLLVAQGLRNQLSGHLRGALNFGATPGEIAAFLDAAGPFLDAEELAFARATLARIGHGN